MEKDIKRIKENILIKMKIEDLLDSFDVNMATKGYKLWPEAVILARKKDYENITDLYIELANRHKSTPAKVERALQHSIKESKDLIQNYFHLNYRIGNKVFLQCLIKQVRVLS